MKKIISILLTTVCLLSNCSMPEDERKLKDHYDKLEELAQTSEAKENINSMYKKALEKLRESKKEKEELSKISYNEKGNITNQLFEFCDELWVDQNYNPAKYEVKCKEFKFKSVNFDGTISYIVSKDGDNYIAMFYKRETIEINDFSNKSRDIVFLINTDTPEQIMEFKEGDMISVKGVLGVCNKIDSYDDQTYFFNVYNPIISVAKSKSDNATEETNAVNQVAQSNEDWIDLKIGEAKNNFTFSKQHTLLYNDKIVANIKIRNSTEKIYVSQRSPNGKFAICFTYGDYKSEYKLPGFYLCNLTTLTASSIDLSGPPLLWLSWSANNSNVIVGSYYEADMTLYSIDINKINVTKMEFPSEIKKDASGMPLEEITYETEGLKWVSESTFNIIANINCNPYSDDESCDNDTRKNILRSYTFTYDVQNNQCINNKINNKK